jgi:hypothetical protein
MIPAENITAAYNGTNDVPTIHFNSLVPVFTEICRYFTIILALAGLAFEVVQMRTKLRYYWTAHENLWDIFIFVSALVVTVVTLFIDYNRWVHSLGTFTMVCTGGMGAWLLSKMPTKLGNKFVMLFAVVSKVFVFTPVLLVPVVVFALVFHNLLQNQDTFATVGLSIVKVMSMGIGELDYGDVFFDDTNNAVFSLVAFFLFVLFLGVMTISMMNLLIGVAVGDVDDLRDTGEITAFKSMVDLILQYSYMFPTDTTKIHRMELHRLRKAKLVKPDDRSKLVKVSEEMEAKFKDYCNELEDNYVKYEISTTTTVDGNDVVDDATLTSINRSKTLEDKLEELKQEMKKMMQLIKDNLDTRKIDADG